MSQFSENLKYLIEKSGETVYQLAKNSGIDRTTIQKSISGDRLPSREAINKIQKSLKLSPGEERCFLENYEIAKMGDQLYYQRKEVLKFVNTISKIYETIDDTTHLPSKNITFNANNFLDTEMFKGELQIQKLIQTIIEEEVFDEDASEFLIAVPFEYQFLYRLLQQYFLEKENKLSIQNIFSVSKEVHGFGEKDESLTALQNILPFFITEKSGYEPYFFYDEYNAAHDISLVMPFYIITKKCVIVLSSDYETALLFRGEIVVNVYKEAFQEMKKSCKLLSKRSADIMSIYGEIAFILKTTSSFEPLPCIAEFATKKTIESMILNTNEYSDALIEFGDLFYSRYRNEIRENISFFSINAIRKFAQDGIIINFITPEVRALNTSERIDYLALVRDKIAICKDRYFGVKEKILNNNAPFEIMLVDSCDVFLRFYGKKKTLLNSIFIEEKNISNMFADFFEYLPKSNLVYPTDEILQILEELISELKGSDYKALFS